MKPRRWFVREVLSVNREKKTDYDGVLMFELNLDVCDHGVNKNVDVLLLEEDYNMIRERGYYLC